MLPAALLLTLAVFSDCGQARRYRTCDEGCCVHEYCAYHRICYPRIHCGLGCPDGHCVGQDRQASESATPAEEIRSPQHLTSSSVDSKLNVAKVLSGSQIISERYSYKDSPDDVKLPAANEIVDETDRTRSSSRVEGSADIPPQRPDEDTSSGICMPYQPCHQGDACGLGHSCTFNYNLGYHVCQYNLDIGSTLCYDNKGNPSLQSLS